MTLNWRKELEIAQYLDQPSFMNSFTDLELLEHWKRAVVAKLYYSSFHHSIDVADKLSEHLSPDLKFFYNEGNAHGVIRLFYTKLGNRYSKSEMREDLFKVAEGLEDLHTHRKICDYQRKIHSIDKILHHAKLISHSLNTKLSELEILLDNSKSK